jgi:hypothetical protein
VAAQVSGRKVVVAGVQADAPAAAAPGEPRQALPPAQVLTEPQPGETRSLREQAMADAGVQALLEVFPAEIRDVEEM